MINKKRLFKSLIIILLIIVIIVTAIQIRKTLARYETTTEAERNIDVAFFIMDESIQEQKLLIEDIYPRDETYTYTFTVSNSKNNKIAETDIEYNLVITTTTNLPLIYEIQKNGVTYSGITETLYNDESGTVYKKIDFATEENSYPLVMDTISSTTFNKTKITDEYTLVVKFPTQSYVGGVEVNNRENLNYPDLMEDIKITLSARQKID